MTSLPCRLINACIAAYDITDKGHLDHNNPYLQKVGLKPGAPVQAFIHGHEKINACFLAETYDNWVVLSIRGTLPPFSKHFWSWIDDWLQDFKAGPTDWRVNGTVVGQVETGFSDAMLNLWSFIQSGLSNIKDLHTKNGILVTGHSKGAAMTALAATLLNGILPHMFIQTYAYAMPMCADRAFAGYYASKGLDANTVRYQNEDDIVPYLPYVPTFGLLSSLERRLNNGENKVITRAQQSIFENDYVPLGGLRYIAPGCTIETGTQGERDAWDKMKLALLHLEFEKIIDAHSAKGRYCTCLCS